MNLKAMSDDGTVISLRRSLGGLRSTRLGKRMTQSESELKLESDGCKWCSEIITFNGSRARCMHHDRAGPSQIQVTGEF